MTPEQWRRVSGIFHEALAAEPEARSALLDAACAGDGELRRQVERLLAAHERAGPFGEVPLFLEPGALTPEPAARPALAASAAGASATVVPSHGARPSAAPGATATGRRRGRTFRALAAALTVAYCLYAAWFLWAHGGPTSLGWRAAPDRTGVWHVSAVDASGPAAGVLQPGDALVAVNGRAPVPEAGPGLELHTVRAGATYEVVVGRDGARLPLRLTAAPAPLAATLTYLLVSLVWCGVGLFIGFARPDTELGRLACATALATGLVFLHVGVLQGGPLWQPLHAVLGFHFLARFPTGQPTAGRWRQALGAMYLAGGVAAALGLLVQATLLARGPAGAAQLLREHAWLLGMRMPLALPTFAVAVAGMILALAHNYRRLADADQRRRVRWVVYAGIVALAPSIWWTAVTVLELAAGPVPVPRLDLLVNGATVAIPLAMAYAVVKHRVLDISVVVRRGVRYLLARRALQAATAVPFVALLYIVAVNRHRTVTELATETFAYAFWLALAGAALRFRQPIQLWLDRRFFRDEHDREQLVLKLLDRSRRVESLAELSDLVGRTLGEALRPASVFLWFRDPRERAQTAGSSALATPPDFPANERWLRWLERHAGAGALPPPLAGADLSSADARWLEARGVRLIVPIADADDRLIGALLLGEKRSEEPYDDRDARFLSVLARQTGVIRENLHLRARLSEEVRVRHDVLARLDPRLPDLLKECPVCGACFEGATERCPADDAALVLTLPVARTVDGRYRLERLLGKGGMGAVYEARDLRLERAVAVKIMPGRAFGRPAALRRFRREARAAARLTHPNIVTVHDVGALDGEGAYIVMERIRGETLRAVLERDGRLTPAAAARWFEPLLDGIAAAHASGIVHRDLKPENLMGRRCADGALAVKILDLGLAKLRDEQTPASGTVTVEGTVMGTPDYMSPEQLLGHEADHRSDLFAVGVMLLEALTGRRRLPDDGPVPAANAPRDDEPLPPALLALLRRCLAADPRERPASAAALRAELVPLLRRG